MRGEERAAAPIPVRRAKGDDLAVAEALRLDAEGVARARLYRRDGGQLA